jgi:hypothetical protein
MHEYDARLMCRHCKRAALTAYLLEKRDGAPDECPGRDLYVFHWPENE